MNLPLQMGAVLRRQRLYVFRQAKWRGQVLPAATPCDGVTCYPPGTQCCWCEGSSDTACCIECSDIPANCTKPGCKKLF
jgi:hypothetical protein